MNQKSDKAISNRVATILFTVLGSLLFAAYIIEVVKGSKTPVQVLILSVLNVVPIIICWVLYKKDNETDLIKHVMAVGYGIFILAVYIITNERLVFVYTIPMIIVVMLFNDMKFSIKVGILVSIVTIFHAIKTSVLANWSVEAVAQTEIEVLVIIVVSIFIVLCNRVIVTLNANKMQAIDEAGKKTNDMLASILTISNEMAEEVADVSEKMESLAESTDETLTAMQEVTSGSTETAESVQNQLHKTEEIQIQIDKVSEATENIGKSVADAVEAIHEGRDNINKLIEQSKISENAGKSAMVEVEELEKSTTQMQTIIELINNVASQTSLLALNASIEAARAGEAGRGFAVVASEISNLARQTQTATSQISDLVSGISNEMNDVIKAIESLVESNEIQNESANVTAGSFGKIVESTREIRSNSGELSAVVTTLATANEEIVESIQTISAISEEVSAHSNTTCEVSEQNKSIVENVMTSVQALFENAEKLKNIK